MSGVIFTGARILVEKCDRHSDLILIREVTLYKHNPLVKSIPPLASFASIVDPTRTRPGWPPPVPPRHHQEGKSASD